MINTLDQTYQINEIRQNVIFLKVKLFSNWLVLLAIIVSVSLLLYIIAKQERISRTPNADVYPIRKQSDQYLIENSGCKIPLLYSNKQFNLSIEPMVCSYQNTTTPLVLSDETSLWVDEDALSLYGIKNSGNVQCCYTELYRPTFKARQDFFPPYRYKATCKPFWKKENISMEFVRIKCSNNGTDFYTDFHSFVPIKGYVEERCKKLSASEDNLNVLMLGIDSVSRLNFHRTMKKTSQYLHKMDAIEMTGYNKADFATIDNLFLVTTGRFMNEIKKTCWKDGNHYLDTCNFIWKDFKSKGYRTAYVEDTGDRATFQPLQRVFSQAPTDYYGPPFYTAAEKEIGDITRPINFCVGTRLLFETLLTYTDKFVKAMADRLYFAIFWESSLTHEGLTFAKLVDDSYATFLRNLSLHPSFNKTVLILLSDHGFQRPQERYQYTQLGYQETCLPMLFFVFPKWFESRYPAAISNLKRNSRRLTTPLDLHETLKDLSDCTLYLNNANLEQRAIAVSEKYEPRAISLFLPISGKRTCKDAGILSEYCTCEDCVTYDVQTDVSRNLALRVLQWINYKTAPHQECLRFSMNRIVYVNVKQQLPKRRKGPAKLGWNIVLETYPGYYTFEATGTFVNGKDRNALVEQVNPASENQFNSRCLNNSIDHFCYCRKK